jgi:inner membrane protein involved in colicin E2 resistance
VFRSRLRGIIALFAFSGAYGLIYLLMKSEDYALLIGSAAAFGAIVLTMYVTRSLIGAAGAIRHKKRSEAGEAKRSQDQWFN